MATANATFDVRAPGRTRRVTPFVVAGAGLFNHRAPFGAETFSSSEGAFTAGGGLRVALSDRWHVGGEWRVGWELHSRTSVMIGLR